MTENEAIKRVKEFGLHHAIKELPSSTLTVQAFETAISALEEIQQYHSIGTVEECREARERQTPKQPDIWGDGCDNEGKIIYDMYDCPNCGKSYEIEGEEYKHCPNCGQSMNLAAAIFDNPEFEMRIKALSGDVKSMDGHHAYLELVDEYHAYKTNEEKEFCDTDTEISWRKLISEVIDRVYDRMIMNTPPESEDERLHCEAVKEAVKGMFLKESRSELEAKFIVDNIAKYEEIFEICMNGNDLQFKKGLIELQRMQNEYILDNESGIL